MLVSASDKFFTGPVPELYERFMVPLLFEPYATDLAARAAQLRPLRVLEIAAGTGVVTRQLAASLPPSTSIVATDISQEMLNQAQRQNTSRPVLWQQADAMQLPFDDETFDLVVCQFGVMFFPEKTKALSEARRVLCSGGQLLFNTWDKIQENEFVAVVQAVLEKEFPSDPPRFMVQVPHGYFDPRLIAQNLLEAGFQETPKITTLTLQSRASSASVPAMAYCQGTPLSKAILARRPTGLKELTELATAAIGQRFGWEEISAKMQALVVLVQG